MNRQGKESARTESIRRIAVNGLRKLREQLDGLSAPEVRQLKSAAPKQPPALPEPQ